MFAVILCILISFFVCFLMVINILVLHNIEKSRRAHFTASTAAQWYTHDTPMFSLDQRVCSPSSLPPEGAVEPHNSTT